MHLASLCLLSRQFIAYIFMVLCVVSIPSPSPPYLFEFTCEPPILPFMFQNILSLFRPFHQTFFVPLSHI